VATVTGRTVSLPLPPCDTPPGIRAIQRRPDGVSQAELARAVPPGSRRIRGQREALRGGLSCPDLADVRADFRDHLTAWWQVHVNHASWGGQGRPPRGTSEPTRAKVCELAGRIDPETGERRPMSVSTYKRCSRWWRARGYAAIVRPGWTPALRPMALTGPEDHNERQVLVLCLPRKKHALPSPGSDQTLTGPLSGSRSEPDKAPHAREAENQDKPEKARAPRGQSLLPRPGPAPLGTVPQSGSEALAAARAMQERVRLLRGLSAEHLRHLARPFWRAGWRPADVLHALDHEPGGRQHGYTAAVRFPAAWIRARLAAWLRPDGSPLPSPGQLRAAAAARARAAAAARRDEAARLEAARTTDTRLAAARARAMLAARGGTVARDLSRWQTRPGGTGPAPAFSGPPGPNSGPGPGRAGPA
jgi:hypothetical protein